MLKKAGLDWTVSKQPLYFPMPVAEGEKTRMRLVPDEFALIRDSDLSVLDTVGSQFKPVQNHEVFDFFKRFVKAGDMEMETAGSLKGGRFVWALAKIKDGAFSLPKGDKTESYLLLSQPHQFGYSLTATLTAIRVVCWNTLNYALGAKLDGSGGSHKGPTFRMVHSRKFDDEVKAEAELALGLAHQGIKEYSHTAKLLSQSRATDDSTTDYFWRVLRLDHEDVPNMTDEEYEAFVAEAEDNRRMKRFREALTHAPGQDLFKGTWWNAFNAVTYTVDHVAGQNENRLYRAWYGSGSVMKRRALDLAVEFAKAA
jgi:phage/plasmid-like protein (TIGR03299 family)